MEQLYPSQSHPVCTPTLCVAPHHVRVPSRRKYVFTDQIDHLIREIYLSPPKAKTRPGIRLLAEHKSDIMQHMNADHKDALILLAKRVAGIEAQEAEMTSVDRLGFHLRLKTQDGVKGTRVAFLREVSDPSQTREVFVEMVKQARHK